MPNIIITPQGKEHFSQHPVKGVLFDLDGVIIDTEKLYTRFWQEAAISLGFNMEKRHALGLRSLNHKAAQERLHDWFGPEADYALIRNKRIQLMDAFIAKHGIEAKPGILPLLQSLREKQIPYCIATASAKDKVETYLSQLELLPYFEDIVTAYDVAKGKPEPDIYLAAAARIHVDPSDCIALEDSMGGLLSAYRAGCAPVMVPDQDEPDEKALAIISAAASDLEAVITLLP